MKSFFNYVCVAALASFVASTTIADEKVIMVDSRINQCVSTTIPDIISGKAIATEYVDVRSNAYTALGGGWKSAVAADSRAQVVAAMEDAVITALLRGTDGLLEGIQEVTTGFTAEPRILGGNRYAISGVLEAVGSSVYAGKYNFNAVVLIYPQKCLLRSISVAIISSDAFDLGRWIRTQPEIAAVRKQFNLPSAD